VSRWAIDGRGYRFAPFVEAIAFVEHEAAEDMGTAANRPPFGDEREGNESVLVRRIVYDVVENLLGESRQHGGAI
jgi:hypothetical protein